MSGPTRPIPIGHGHRSQRSSPVGIPAVGEFNLEQTSPNGAMISQSCPVNGHSASFFTTRYQPPRAPVIGSLPEPSFMLAGGDSGMPELVLPPPAQNQTGSRREPSFIPVASSCPSDIGYLRDGFPMHQHSWAPSPRTADDFDLSKSPALAVMSAMREGRRPPQYHSNRQSRIPEDDITDSSTASNPRYFFREEDELDVHLQTQQMAMEHLSLGESRPPRRGSDTPLPPLGLPPRRPERRGSYDGGVFDFEDQ
ncbi:hypothetical protein Poli38472_010505 [Pythium oligandrum]|uniref:Uncharacterized protein n=1 Tax=Pythium oligandrum TaxID=41045 RepID=A0A8K1C376_PYTOL|nr:hypothetical protein Poli38472_010505 [Pythium oligandrum]|eukprot:TMW55623.1 hypothetical protein Poli38472_010505 [Pythium oligandrum]